MISLRHSRLFLASVLFSALSVAAHASQAVLVGDATVDTTRATTNLGTLSRYRMPLIPYYALLLSVLSARLAQRDGADAAARWHRSPKLST